MIEKLLGILAGADEASRIELVQVGEPGELPTLELRMQHESGELGWLTHKRIALAPGQIPALRDALNLMDLDARDTRRQPAPPAEGNVVSLAAYRQIC